MCTLSAVFRSVLNLQTELQINVKLIDAPSYVKTLDAQNNVQTAAGIAAAAPLRRIVLVYKAIEQQEVAAPRSLRDFPLLQKIKKSRDDNDIGTPLEDDGCDILDLIEDDDVLDIEMGSSGRRRTWLDGEDVYGPVALDDCRRILNTVNALPCTEHGAAVWTLCGGGEKNQSKTTTSAHNEADTDFLLMMWRFEKKWNKEGFCRFTGWHHYRDIDIHDLHRRHLSYLRKATSCGPIDVEAQYETQFYVNAAQTVCLSWDATTSSSSTTYLTASAAKSKPLSFSALATAGYRKADIVVVQTLRIGGAGFGSASIDDKNSASVVVADYWRQLLRLDGIKKAIIDYRERRNPHGQTALPEFVSGGGLSMSTIRERVQKILLDAEMLWETDVIVGVAGNTMNELEPVIRRSSVRNLSEVTDQLWMLLKLCSSYDDLKSALNFVFLCAAKCNVVNTPNTNTRLGVIIGEIARQRLAVPCLSGAEPLELLLEIGLQKAGRDYAYVFGESNLCVNAEEFLTAAQLCGQSEGNQKKHSPASSNLPADRASIRKTMMQSIDKVTTSRNTDDADDGIGGSEDKAGLQNSRFDRLASEHQLSRLAHAHLLMEHVLLVQINLNCQDFRDYVASDLRRVAKPFATYKTLIHDVREIPLPVSSNLIGKVEGVEPNLVKIRLRSQSQYVSVQNTFVYSTQSLFPGNVYPQLQQSDEQTRDSPTFCGLNFVQLGTLKM